MSRIKPLKIFFLDSPTVDLGDLELKTLRKIGDYKAYSLRSEDPLPAETAAAEVVISNKYPLGERQFQAMPHLKLIAVAATGVNNVDLEAARSRSIAVANAVGYSTTTVVEHALLFLLACAHRLRPHLSSVDSGEWSRSPYFADLNYPYSDLSGKTLGIVGLGTIGKKVAALAKGLGMKVLIAKLPGRKYPSGAARLPLKAVLQKSDFVSLHCPLSPLTTALIDAEKLGWMRPSAYLLNLARGPIVQESAVADALRSGKLAGYASDVMTQETPPADHPLLAPDIREKILITPHIAWASRESRQRLIDEIAENIRFFLGGKKLNRIV